MTPQEHNRTLGICHIVYGFLNLLTLAAMMVIFAFIFTAAKSPRGVAPFPNELVALFMGIILITVLPFMIPTFVAGYGMLKGKKWAKIWGIIAAATAAMSFPFGTALCAYSLWFLLGEKGKQLYDKPEQRFDGYRPLVMRGAPQPAGWTTRQHERERERDYTYAPPHDPPNWRGE
jgi:hypothetical protein